MYEESEEKTITRGRLHTSKLFSFGGGGPFFLEAKSRPCRKVGEACKYVRVGMRSILISYTFSRAAR